mgnify:CR=1 FL=1
MPPPTADPPTVPRFERPLSPPIAWLEGIDNQAYVEALYRAGVAHADALLGRLLGRMAEALDAADRDVPAWLATAANETASGDVETALFAMF